ncbi:hypothetical protein R84B8_01219 [Treponema sp. R8-4-B8]
MAIRFNDGANILRALHPPLDLETRNSGLCQFINKRKRLKVIRGEEISICGINTVCTNIICTNTIGINTISTDTAYHRTIFYPTDPFKPSPANLRTPSPIPARAAYKTARQTHPRH